MATFAGLFVEVGANIASFVSGMTKMEVLASKTTKSIMRDFDNMGSKIGGALAGGTFLYLAKGSIDAMDKLNDLSKSTNITVETLGALGIAAAQSGTDLAGMATSLNKLSMNIGRDAEKFKALGITAKDPLEALKQLADVFVQIQDPQLKAAVAAEALGKQWQTLAPFLSEGSKGISDMIERNKEWAVVTSGSAKAADEFNDKMALIFKSGVGMATVIGPLLPLLNRLADGFLDAAKASLKTTSDFKPLLEIGKLVTIVFGEFWYMLTTIGKEMGGIAAQLGLLSDAFVKFKMGDYKGAAESLRQFSSIGKDMQADAEQARAAHDKWVVGIQKIGTAADVSAFAVDELAETYEQTAKRGGKGMDALAKKFMDFNKVQSDAKKDAEELAAAIATMQGFDPKFAKEVELYNKALASGAVSADDYAKAMTKLIEKQPRYTAELKKTLAAAEQANKEAEDAIELDARMNRMKDDTIKSLRQEAEQLELEVRMAGLSNAERARSIALLQLQAVGFKGTAEEVQKFADRIYNATVALESLNNTRRVVDEIGSRIAEVAVSFTESWEKGIESVKRMVRQLATDLVAFFAKKWTLQLIAGAMGGTAGAAVAGDAASFGANTLTGMAGNALTSYLGLGAMASNFGTGIAAGWAGSATVPMAGYAMPALETAAGAFGAELGALLANPATWVIAAAVIAFAIARSREGGPKEGGSFTSMFDSAGNLIGSGSAIGHDGGRLFTPSSQDRAMESMTQSFASGFFSVLQRLGGSTGALGFSLGTDQDPRGTAVNHVMGQIQRDGQIVWQQMVDAGRDNEDLQRGFAQVMSRMMLAGLQQSNLPHGIARILNTVSAATGSTEEVNGIIQLAMAFGDLMGVVTGAFTAGGVVESANRTAMELFGAYGDSLVDLAGKTAFTTEGLAQLTQETVAYLNAAAQLILVYEKLRTSITGTIDSMIETTVLAGMTAQQQFTYWQDKANGLFNDMLASTDPAEIERLFGQFTTAWNNAWSLLSPEQQAAQGGDWADRLRIARDQIDTHLTGLATDVETSVNDVLKIVGDKLDLAADKYAAAADKTSASTDRFSAAVDRGIDVNVSVDNLATEVGGGGG